MKTNHITIRADRLYSPLEPLAVGKLSSAVLTVGGDIPDDVDSLAVVIEYMDNSGAEPTVARYTANGTAQGDGTWCVYLAPTYFPECNYMLQYHVVGTDERNNPRWLGSGVLRVLNSPVDGSAVVPDILPKNLYAYNPTTRLYYKVTAEINELGEVSLATEQEGVSL